MPSLTTPFLPRGSIAAHPQPTLSTDELSLRPWTARDVPAVLTAYDDPAIQHWHAKTMNEDEARAWLQHWLQRWRQESGAGWAITVSDVVLGQVSLRSVDLAEGLGELSYWVLPAGRGRALAPRAVSALTRWLFEAPACTASKWPTPPATAPRAGWRPKPASLQRAPSAKRPCTLTDGTTCTYTHAWPPIKRQLGAPLTAHAAGSQGDFTVIPLMQVIGVKGLRTRTGRGR